MPHGEAGKHVICVDDNDVPDTASIPVTLALLDGVYHVTPVGDTNLRFQLLLQVIGPTTIYGPVLGQARDPATGVVVTISPPVDPYYPTQGDATLSGLLAPGTSRRAESTGACSSRWTAGHAGAIRTTGFSARDETGVCRTGEIVRDPGLGIRDSSEGVPSMSPRPEPLLDPHDPHVDRLRALFLLAVDGDDVPPLLQRPAASGSDRHHHVAGRVTSARSRLRRR